jgi:hypothetical protein
MSEKNLQYLSGKGWLIFSGGNTVGSEIRAQAIARAKTYGITAYISKADDEGDSLLDDMVDLGARTGYFIDLEYDDPEEMLEQLKTASLIAIEIGSSLNELYHALSGAALEGIKQAYERGGVVLIEGLAVNLFGRWFVSDEGEILDGFNWVLNAFIEPESTGIEDSRAVQTVLQQFEDAIAINIASGSALVVGGEGQVEIWGEDKNVTISLGRGYTAE